MTNKKKVLFETEKVLCETCGMWEATITTSNDWKVCKACAEKINARHEAAQEGV